MLQMGVVEPSKSPYCAPLLLVRRKDESYRPVIDFRQLNKNTRFDAEPIPNPEAIFAKLGGKCYFSRLDFSKGYWQITMSPADREKTAFVSPRGLFHFLRMPFGLVNAGATYSRMTRVLLAGVDDVDNYIDVVVIHSKTWQAHLSTLEEVFKRVRDANLTVKPSKCILGSRSIDFVGHGIAGGCLTTQDDKVQKVRDARTPSTKKQVRAFLGLTGYYRRFVPHYAQVATPQSDLTKKGRPDLVKWSDEAELAFKQLKAVLCSDPVLKLPDFCRPFVIRTDAFNVGLGAVLLQIYDGVLFPIAYASKRLSETQEAYATVEKECLSIIWALDKFYLYLYGRHFTIQTDINRSRI